MFLNFKIDVFQIKTNFEYFAKNKGKASQGGAYF